MPARAVAMGRRVPRAAARPHTTNRAWCRWWWAGKAGSARATGRTTPERRQLCGHPSRTCCCCARDSSSGQWLAIAMILVRAGGTPVEGRGGIAASLHDGKWRGGGLGRACVRACRSHFGSGPAGVSAWRGRFPRKHGAGSSPSSQGNGARQARAWDHIVAAGAGASATHHAPETHAAPHDHDHAWRERPHAAGLLTLGGRSAGHPQPPRGRAARPPPADQRYSPPAPAVAACPRCGPRCTGLTACGVAASAAVAARLQRRRAPPPPRRAAA